jgi:hypothetical protein
MKFMLLLCGVALLVTGCNTPSNPYGVNGEFGYTYDLVPPPVPWPSSDQLDKIEKAQFVSPPVAAFRAISEAHNDIR